MAPNAFDPTFRGTASKEAARIALVHLPAQNRPRIFLKDVELLRRAPNHLAHLVGDILIFGAVWAGHAIAQNREHLGQRGRTDLVELDIEYLCFVGMFIFNFEINRFMVWL